MHPITNYLKIIETNVSAYKQLQEYHYIKEPVYFSRKVYAIVPCCYFKPKFPKIIGVFVISPPMPRLRARNRTIPELQNFPGTLSEKHKFITHNFTYMSRLVIDPRFRRLGLATWLITECVPLQKYRYIESLSPIDFTNDMFRKIGFEVHVNESPHEFHVFATTLQKYGITGSQLKQPGEAQKRIDRLDPDSRKDFDYRLTQFLWQYKRRKYDTDPLKRITYALSKFPYPHCYLLKREKFESKNSIKKKTHHTTQIRGSYHRTPTNV